MNISDRPAVRIYCCCGKQALPIECGVPSRDDEHTTTLKGAKAGFHQEVFCGYCSEEMDEDGLFPEEQKDL